MTSKAARAADDVTPSARSLIRSLRDIGYDFQTALADIVDNSVAAGASEVDIRIVFADAKSYVTVTDDGCGMTESELVDSLRFGSAREYGHNELGRYGLGLKTASISQARRLTVISRKSSHVRRVTARTLDLDHIDSSNRWEIVSPPSDSAIDIAEVLRHGPGTVVAWENLDRVLPLDKPSGGWARRRIELLATKSADYLGMVFHRFLEGGPVRPNRLRIRVNGEAVRPWNPFAPGEKKRIELSPQVFELTEGHERGHVRLSRFILPSRETFSSPAEFERLAGPRKWNRQQGLYIYRANRLIQSGGWSGLRAPDEHTKYARAALDFDTDLDTMFRINVAKMRVALPAAIKPLLERPLHDLCSKADATYRRDADRRSSGRPLAKTRAAGDSERVGSSLIASALDAKEFEALDRIMEAVRSRDPDAARALGWGG